MNVKILKTEAAFQNGAELWVLPSPKHSEFTKRLDWPLNLQLSRALHHPAPSLHPSLQKALQEMSLLAEVEPVPGPLLIASRGLLPNEWTAVVLGEDWNKWALSGLEIWKNLKVATVRFFLPPSLSSEKILTQWPKWADVDTVEVVEAGG